MMSDDDDTNSKFLRRVEAPASPMKFAAGISRGPKQCPDLFAIKHARMHQHGPLILKCFSTKVILRCLADTEIIHF